MKAKNSKFHDFCNTVQYFFISQFSSTSQHKLTVLKTGVTQTGLFNARKNKLKEKKDFSSQVPLMKAHL